MTLPNIFKSRELHISNLVCNFWIFLSKLSSLFSLILYEKYIPNILTGQWNHFKSRGLFLLLFHFPNQSALVFFTFRDRLAIRSKSPTILISKDSMSALNRVVSAANWDSLISLPFLSRWNPDVCYLRVPPQKKINKDGETGQPCRTSFDGLNQLVIKPLFCTALSVFV